VKTLAEVLDWHFVRYPLMQASDIYKLLHQGVFGPGHIVGPGIERQGSGPEPGWERALRRALEDEMASLVAARFSFPDESATEIEPLDPDGRLIRVNLRPLLNTRDVASHLAGVLAETCRTVIPDPAVMNQRLSEAVVWCAKNIPEQVVELEEMAAASKGFAAIHHSATYFAAYRPAYRVVRRDLWDRADRG